MDSRFFCALDKILLDLDKIREYIARQLIIILGKIPCYGGFI